MNANHSDALVFFGATGDLAYKKIFPSLQAMLKRGHLNVPVIGVAKAGWNLDQLKARAKDSLEKHGGLDAAAFARVGTGAGPSGSDAADSTSNPDRAAPARDGWPWGPPPLAWAQPMALTACHASDDWRPDEGIG